MKWYTPKQACDILGVHINTLRDRDRRGKIPTMRTAGGTRRYF